MSILYAIIIYCVFSFLIFSFIDSLTNNKSKMIVYPFLAILNQYILHWAGVRGLIENACYLILMSLAHQNSLKVMLSSDWQKQHDVEINKRVFLISYFLYILFFIATYLIFNLKFGAQGG